MKKIFMGGRIRRLRDERSLTQKALADGLGLSLSYLNQIENNQRPLTAGVLLKLNAAFGVDIQVFSEDEEARLIGALKDVFLDPGAGETITTAEIMALAANSPAIGRAVVALHRNLSDTLEKTVALSAGLGTDRGQGGALLPTQPFEEVRDYFYRRHNYIDPLDRAAESLGREIGVSDASDDARLSAYLNAHFNVRVSNGMPPGKDGLSRAFDGEGGLLSLSRHLSPGQRSFQLATQIAFLGYGDMLETLSGNGGFTTEEARRLARIGLAAYFAGALILPYERFLESAEACGYDVDLLGETFGVGFETAAHRLSTLQRQGTRGVPFFFIRVDRAGNISKRQSATDFPFSRVGGTCPLWKVYDAFNHPDETLTQVAEMPDGRSYLWVTRAVRHVRGGFGAPAKSFAVALGCELHHAERLIYAKGLRLDDRKARTRIGAGCKVCERTDCPQRAFPFIGRTLGVDETKSAFVPYGAR